MDQDDTLEARNARLAILQTADPVAWAICNGHRGEGTISKFLGMPREQVQIELKRLVKAKEVKRVKYMRGFSHKPLSIEMKRLTRRAYALNKEEQEREYDFGDED